MALTGSPSKHDAKDIDKDVDMDVLSLARPVMWPDGQPEDDGHEQHHPSVDAKGEVPDEEARCPTNDHEDADSKVGVLNQRA